MDDLQLITVAEAAPLLGITQKALRGMIADRAIPFVRISARRLRLRRRDIQNWIDARTTVSVGGAA